MHSIILDTLNDAEVVLLCPLVEGSVEGVDGDGGLPFLVVDARSAKQHDGVDDGVVDVNEVMSYHAPEMGGASHRPELRSVIKTR